MKNLYYLAQLSVWCFPIGAVPFRTLQLELTLSLIDSVFHQVESCVLAHCSIVLLYYIFMLLMLIICTNTCKHPFSLTLHGTIKTSPLGEANKFFCFVMTIFHVKQYCNTSWSKLSLLKRVFKAKYKHFEILSKSKLYPIILDL